MKRQYYVRKGPDDSNYIEDQLTWIMLGRWTHLYNEGTREWFMLTDRPNPASLLERGPGSMRGITEVKFLKRFGWRGRWMIFRDWLGWGLPHFILKRVRRLYREKKFVGDTEPMKLFLEDLSATGDIDHGK